MAKDWIKMRVDLSEDPAVIGIASSLGIDEFSVVGRLHRVWSWADSHTVDGNAHSVTVSWLDRLVCVEGFGKAMVAVGWLEETEDGMRFPKFERHNTQSGKRRALAAKRAEKHRAKSNANSNADSNARSVTKSAPREEKSREEYPPPPAPSCEPWREVEEELRSRGVSAADAAVQAAQGKGRSPAEVVTLLREFDQANGAYQAGALYRRVTGELTRWPAPDQQHQSREDRKAADRRYEKQAAENRAASRRAAQERAKSREDEATYGPILDAMPETDRTDLLIKAIPDPDVRNMTPPNMRRSAMISCLKAQNGKAVAV